MGLYLYITICSTFGANNYTKIRTDNYTWIDILVSFHHSITVSTHFQGNLHNITSNKPPNNDVPWPCVSAQFQITHFLKDPHKHCISIAVPYKSWRITVESYTKTFSCVTICKQYCWWWTTMSFLSDHCSRAFESSTFPIYKKTSVNEETKLMCDRQNSNLCNRKIWFAGSSLN